MKIRKVDDKPMVIHTKEKAKIHAHEPKGAKIKGSNIYTVERGPKTIGAKVSDDKKKSYRKSTIHQSEPKNKGLSRFKRNLKESNISIKTKNTNIHIAGRTGALAAGAVTEQVEGGQEVSQAAYLAYESSRPVTGTASKGAALFRKKAAAEAKKRIKKVEAGKKLAKKTAKKAAKDTAKTVAKETAKETAKITAKVATKTATKAAATAAGTAVAPGVGTAIGMVAGYAAGVSIEVKDEKMTNRSRKIKFFLDKMKAQENQTDSGTDCRTGAVVTCSCSCHDCCSGYCGDSNPLQFSMNKRDFNVVGNEGTDNQELAKGIAFVKSRRAELNVVQMVESMRDQAMPNGVIINDAYCDRSMTRDYDREGLNAFFSTLKEEDFEVVVVRSLNEITDDIYDLEEFVNTITDMGIWLYSLEVGPVPITVSHAEDFGC